MGILTVMGTFDIPSLLFLFLLLVVFPGLVWGISAFISRKKSVQLTGYATVKSHRVWRDSCWNYLVTFAFSDGSTIELRTVKGDYETLTDGQSGQVTWQEDLFLHFDPDLTP